MGTEVAGFRGRTGDHIWTTQLDVDSTDAVISYVQSTDGAIYILSTVEKQRLYVHRLNATSGDVEKKAWFPAPWLTVDSSSATPTSCVMMGGVVICLDMESQQLFHGSGERFIMTSLDVSTHCLRN